jgi:hypothetical protein
VDIIFNLIVGFSLIENWFDGHGSIVHLAIGIITIGLGIRIALNKPRIRDMLFSMNIIKSSWPSSKEV